MDVNEILRDYLNDILGVEKHCLEAVERHTGDERYSTYPDAHGVLLNIETTLRSHVSALDRCLSSLDGGVESVIKKAAASAIGALSGIYDKIRPEDPVSRGLRDFFTTLSHAAIGYTMLYTTACALNEQEVSDLALRHLNELTPLIVGLSRVIPSVVSKELEIEGKVIDGSKWRLAIANTQKAWSSDVVGKYH